MDISFQDELGLIDEFDPEDGFVLDADRVEPGSDGTVLVPDSRFLTEAMYERFGTDLLLTLPDGHALLVVGYFEGDAPTLRTENGEVVGPELVQGFITPMPDFSGAVFETQVATIYTLTGDGFAIRSDGTRVDLVVGDPVFGGDQLATMANSLMAMRLNDDSLLALGESARLRMGLGYDSLSVSLSDPASVLSDLAMLRGDVEFTPSPESAGLADSLRIATPNGEIVLGSHETRLSYQISADSTPAGLADSFDG